MNLPDFLTQSSDGDVRLSGHRIGLYHIVRAYNDGDSAEMIALEYPTLPLSLIHKVIAFYLENRGEVDAYMAACSADLAEHERTARHVDLDELRRRLPIGEPSIAPGTKIS